MSEIKLLPCPFCGGEANLCDNGDLTYINYYWIYCKDCGCKQPISIHREAVINVWNTRKPMQDICERLEEKKKNICGSYNYATPVLERPSCKVAFNNGICEAIAVVKEVGGMNEL